MKESKEKKKRERLKTGTTEKKEEEEGKSKRRVKSMDWKMKKKHTKLKERIIKGRKALCKRFVLIKYLT